LAKGIFINNPSKISDTVNSKLLKKIITGKEITIEDEMIGRISYSNKLSLITFINRHDVLLNYTNRFPTNIINLSHIEDMEELFLDNEDLDWLRVPFALYGLTLLENSIKLTKVKIDKSNLQDSITNEFFHLFCTINIEYEIYATDLYDAYVKYYKTKYNDAPLSRIKFTKGIKQLLETVKDSDLVKYYRPHHSRENNKYAFKGIYLNKENLNTFLQSNIEKQPPTDFQTFYKYLLQMNQLMPPELY